jgi:hypothetical protein
MHGSGWTFTQNIRPGHMTCIDVDSKTKKLDYITRTALAQVVMIAALTFPGCGDAGKATTLSCDAQSSGLLLSYTTTLAADGSRFVNCEVQDAAAGYSHSELYIPGRQGIRTGGCIVAYDVDANTGGWWYFSMEDMSATYNDAGSASDGFVVPFREAACTH